MAMKKNRVVAGATTNIVDDGTISVFAEKAVAAGKGEIALQREAADWAVTHAIVLGDDDVTGIAKRMVSVIGNRMTEKSAGELCSRLAGAMRHGSRFQRLHNLIGDGPSPHTRDQASRMVLSACAAETRKHGPLTFPDAAAFAGWDKARLDAREAKRAAGGTINGMARKLRSADRRMREVLGITEPSPALDRALEAYVAALSTAAVGAMPTATPPPPASATPAPVVTAPAGSGIVDLAALIGQPALLNQLAALLQAAPKK